MTAGKQSDWQKPPSSVHWVDAADNPWGVRLLDVRSFTTTMISTSTDPKCAENAVSFGRDDGLGFVGQSPLVDRVAAASLRLPIDGWLADGALFIPREMEHKWALFYHRRQILCVRSWKREVQVVAEVEPHAGHVEVVAVRGTFTSVDEDPDFTVRALDYLLRSHALRELYPAPLPLEMENDPSKASMWCFSLFGNMALYATPLSIARRDPEAPLRTISLLHIAAARGDEAAMRGQMAAGVPRDVLGPDGLAPLHWALMCNALGPTTMLLDLGAPAGLRSADGVTPLMIAVELGSREKADLLLELGVEVNAQDDRGYAALHRAAEMGNAELVELLLRHGASPAIEAQGQTPRALAEARGENAVVALLRDHGTRASRTPPAPDSAKAADEEKKPRFDRFVGRVEDLVWASCVSCKRKVRGPICEAYPDGIPEEILDGRIDHKTPYPGDHGLIYLPVRPEHGDVEAE